MRLSALYSINTSPFSPPVSINKPTDGPQINFLFSIRPIYYFSRICGLMPFTIVQSSTDDIQTVRVTKLDFLWFITSVSLYSLMAIVCFQTTNYEGNSNKSEVLLIGDRLLLTISLMTSVMKIFFDMFNRFRLIDIWKKLAYFDKEVSNRLKFSALELFGLIIIVLAGG